MLAGMTDDDDLDFDAILKNLRPVNGFWAYGDKRVGEPNTAIEILKEAGFFVDRLVALPEGQDPPDCAGTVDQLHAGIEVTELVNQKRLRTVAGGPVHAVYMGRSGLHRSASTHHRQKGRRRAAMAGRTLRPATARRAYRRTGP